MQKTSVCIITKNRTNRLQNVLKGIALNSKLPDEVLIVHMNENTGDYLPMPFPVRKISFANEHELPLAAARNYAAKMALYPVLIFLDVDCIPADDLVENYTLLIKDDVILTGNVRYLDADFTPEKNLFENSIPHPNRQLKAGYVPYPLFWSLNFACTKNTFDKTGGFDETFTGYGAEDTDFAFSARKNSIALVYANADVYHQYHPTYRPPLNHLKSMVENAVTFYKKWKLWPMEEWLRDFEKSGFIRFYDNKIELVKEPSKTDTDAAFNTNKWGF